MRQENAEMNFSPGDQDAPLAAAIPARGQPLNPADGLAVAQAFDRSGLEPVATVRERRTRAVPALEPMFPSATYVGNRASKDVSMYTLDPTTGQLIPLEPGRVEAGSGPTVVTTTNPFDYQVQQDMLDRAAHDTRFGEPWYGTYGKDLASDPEWEIRGMSFSFAGGRAVFMVHATSKITR